MAKVIRGQRATICLSFVHVIIDGHEAVPIQRKGSTNGPLHRDVDCVKGASLKTTVSVDCLYSLKTHITSLKLSEALNQNRHIRHVVLELQS